LRVFGMRERETGRVIAFPIDNTKATTLLPAIYDNVEKNATVYTDEHRGYTNLAGYAIVPVSLVPLSSLQASLIR
jgi:transposase-like protein